MRRLFVVNTYYQLIMALQMQVTIFSNDKSVVLLSDHSLNMSDIAERIKVIGVFEQVCYIHSKGVWEGRNQFEKAVDGLTIIIGKKVRYEQYIKDIHQKFFDEIICYNYAIDIYGLYACLYEINHNLKVSLFEEGILSYWIEPVYTHRRKFIDQIRRLIKKKAISDSFDHFYCMYPQIYSGSLKVVLVPAISNNSEVSRILKQLFDLKSVENDYRERYIFFTSVYDFEGGEAIGEYELVKTIAGIVGKDNLLVKMHPRDTRDVYKNEMFHVDKNSVIPWEAIQLAGDFSEKIFLTATSGSVLSGSLLSQFPPKTYYLYRLCNIQNNTSAMKSAESIRNLIETSKIKSMFDNITIASSIEEVIDHEN